MFTNRWQMHPLATTILCVRDAFFLLPPIEPRRFIILCLKRPIHTYPLYFILFRTINIQVDVRAGDEFPHHEADFCDGRYVGVDG